MSGDIRKHLGFFGLDQDNRRAFRKIAKGIRKVGPAALDRFYAKVRATPEAARYFKSEEVITAAQGLQLQHWTHLFESNMDDSYVERAHTVGTVHARIGLEPSLYFGAYAQVLGDVIESMVSRSWLRLIPGMRSFARRISVLIRAALFDMDIAMTTVFDTAMSSVAVSAESVRTGAREIAAASDDLAHRTETQAMTMKGHPALSSPRA